MDDALPGFAPTPAGLREELEGLIVGDLLGPAGGEAETLPAKVRVRDRYIVGMLAPKETIALDPERSERTSSAAGIADTSDDTPSDDAEGPAVVHLFPSTLGLSFTTVSDCPPLEVTASWGHYVKEPSEAAGAPAGADERVWRRHRREGAVTITLSEGDIDPLVPVKDQPAVFIRGKAVRHRGGWLVSLFLVNDQEPPASDKDSAWLFQAQMAVEAEDGAPVFCGRNDVLGAEGFADEVGELALLDLQYRRRVEFAVGHGTATHATLSAPDPTRAVRIETTPVPRYVVALTEAPGADDPSLDPVVAELLASVVLDMETLAGLEGDELVAALAPLADAYDRWLDLQEARLASGTDHLADHQVAGRQALAAARRASGRLREGIGLLAPNGDEESDIAEAFRFCNHVMWHQRIHTMAADRRREDPTLGIAATLAELDKAKNRSWRPFQLAFILLNLPALGDVTHPERSMDEGLVDLLFFPTGGGKTEAYLGLAAFTLAIRRLQGTVAGRDGRAGGVAVLMRYTLRLLTAQQFERAAALICACELRRQDLVGADSRWGTEPFRLGMWVGANVAPNRTKDAAFALEDAHGTGRRRSRSATPVQLVACPWCGTRIDPGRHARPDTDRWRTLVFCGEEFGNCPFTEVGSPGEGLPVVTVDEELYRLLPAFVISTADKFAQLPWRGPLHMLFGNVRQRCSRHGYRSDDLDVLDSARPERDKHNKTATLPPAATFDVDPLRPPDLIIQDELHLISGPLGTLVGLYETAIDELASWEVEGKKVRPKVVASTATVRRAEQQVYALFARSLAVFPPPVLDVTDSFFAKERPLAARAGRRYLGLSAPGLRLKSGEVRVFTAILAAAQRLFDRYGAAADPWMTLVGYFSALRELAGARRLVDDEVTNAVYRAHKRGLGQRSLSRSGIQELTSRVNSSDIRDVLDRLKHRFDPHAEGDAHPIDVLLATNMISVGVDVGRLGLMFTVGQPKTTAEYIQATSRVGRAQDGPGLVVTLYNWARPRDLSHYETFEHYHATFYRQVEALSVTPFSPRALDRGLSAVLVALVRQDRAHPSWNPNPGAQSVDVKGPDVATLRDLVVARATRITSDPETGDLVRALLDDRLDDWVHAQQTPGSNLGYEADPKKAVAPLLEMPGIAAWDMFTCPWSLRETEPTVNLLVEEKDQSLVGAPGFVLGKGTAPARPGTDTAEDEDVEDAALHDTAQGTLL